MIRQHVFPLLFDPPAIVLAGHHDGHLQAYTLRGQNLVPVGDALLVRCAHGPDVAIEVVKTHGIQAAVVFAQGRIPIHLVGEQIPGEVDDGDPVVAHAQHIGPFFTEPVYSLVAPKAFPQVGLGVHHEQMVAVVILGRDGVIAEDFARGLSTTIGGHAVLVGLVVVVTLDAMVLRAAVLEEMIFVSRNAIV